MTTENTLQQLARTADDDTALCDEAALADELLHPDLGRREMVRDVTRCSDTAALD